MSGWICVLAAGLVAGCIDRYSPKVKPSAAAQLVVNGYLDPVTGAATITLSGTQSVYTETPGDSVRGATVNIVPESGTGWTLTETKAGVYQLNGAQVSATTAYKLVVETSDGERYESAGVTPRVATPIDSVKWERDDFNEGFVINVFAHGATRDDMYYRWEYVETWQYHSAFQSQLVYNPTTQQLDLRSDNIYDCYHTFPGHDILLADTRQSATNVVPGHKLLFIPEKSPKILVRYSMLVRQFSVSKEEYAFWQLMKNNTENLGTLFDPLPGQVIGNIRCITSSDKQAIGFFSVQHPTEKRMFIDGKSVPHRLDADTGYQKCVGDTLRLIDFNTNFHGLSEVYLFVQPLYRMGFIYAYLYSTKSCVDCRLHGGTLQQPDFW